MSSITRSTLLLLTFLFLSVKPVFSQESTLDVFLDCSSCDQTLIRQKVDYINYTNDAFTADIHILITSQYTGSGGRIYLLKFIGKKDFSDEEFQLNCETDGSATYIEQQEALIRYLSFGLAPFLSQTDLEKHITIQINRPKENDAKSNIEANKDRWNDWIFEVYGNINWNRESSRKTLRLSYGLDIDRVTQQWRVRINPYSYYQERKIEQDDNTIQVIRRHNYLSWSVVKSIDEHWSAGIFNSFNNNSYTNIQLGMSIAPAVEYNLFPYHEVPYKEFTVAYRVGWLNNWYEEETIFFKTKEQKFQQSVNVNLRLRQEWGNVNAGLSGSTYLDDWQSNRFTVDSRLGVRVLKGLSVSLGGNFSIINDQITLPRGDASLEEILLGQRQLATDFELSMNFGFSYTFGALYNNIVNTRL